LRRCHGVDDLLGVEERSLDLAREVLQAAFAAAGIGRRPSSHGQSRKRREIVFEAQVLLNRRLGQPLALQELSDAVEVSCYHLCRLFKQETGVPIHRYRDRLRLRASLERVADGGATLLEIALDLGYSSEAHFSDAFLRAFGIRPSELRRKATRERRTIHACRSSRT
jgi:transcriptional regulator GlxA family with amidase domain